MVLNFVGSIINTASLEGLQHAIYSMAVQGAKVFSGLYNGNIQVPAACIVLATLTLTLALPARVKKTFYGQACLAYARRCGTWMHM